MAYNLAITRQKEQGLIVVLLGEINENSLPSVVKRICNNYTINAWPNKVTPTVQNNQPRNRKKENATKGFLVQASHSFAQKPAGSQ